MTKRTTRKKSFVPERVRDALHQFLDEQSTNRGISRNPCPIHGRFCPIECILGESDAELRTRIAKSIQESQVKVCPECQGTGEGRNQYEFCAACGGKGELLKKAGHTG